MVVKVFCDICGRQVESEKALKRIIVSGWVSDTPAIESHQRSINSVKTDVCQHCLIKFEPTIRDGIDAILDAIVHNMKVGLVEDKMGCVQKENGAEKQ